MTKHDLVLKAIIGQDRLSLQQVWERDNGHVSLIKRVAPRRNIEMSSISAQALKRFRVQLGTQ